MRLIKDQIDPTWNFPEMTTGIYFYSLGGFEIGKGD